MPFALIPFLLLVVPIVEIAVFISVGQLIGLWPTIGFIILTAVIGSILLRSQGISTLNRIRSEIDAKRVPGKELVSGVMIAIAGVLLLTPGFITDALGFLLFVPKLRDSVWSFLKNRVVVVGSRATGRFGDRDPYAREQRGPIDDGELRRPSSRPDVVDLSGDEFKRRRDPTSPWNAGKDDGKPTIH
ncbi:FxsA cytoplasmic membrane protein [Fulvimarina pelagi HTCC2506]|uniref:FxsA cytoplasmic membrane protein n=2 Tax=Fulvimarina pelagi TaxID=217511 RepID=Q0G2Z7_9HYPH|nr:FxsA family protein [Fulvimarina pelagi]EAU42034.1 FxsA cytoplasmic membrane protein [Fulvimarina pelagi HTCC2506]BAT31005.1 FxsA cytoplasmic membrane protein [Fulvimarina pelagi]